MPRTFRLPPGVPADAYEMPGDLGNTRRWRARVFAANCGDARVGDMDGVGYLLVGRDEDVVIPVALGDEHRMGFDMLRQQARAWGVEGLRLAAVHPHSPFYLYADTDVAKLAALFRRLREGGFPNVWLNLPRAEARGFCR